MEDEEPPKKYTQQKLGFSTVKQQTIINGIAGVSIEESAYRCLACWEDDEPLRRVSCCKQIIHEECYARYIQRNLDYSKPRRITDELRSQSRDERDLKEKVRQEMAKLCPHCKSAIPTLWELSNREIIELKQIPLHKTGFAKAESLIQRQVTELAELTYQQKLTLNFMEGREYEEISYPQVSVHPSDVSSNEVSESFSDMIDFTEGKDDKLTHDQKYKLKRLRASGNAWREKMMEQQLEMLNTIHSLRDQIRQHDSEKEKELQEKLQEQSMKELARKDQIEFAVDAFKEYKERLCTTEDWLHSLIDYKSDGTFEKVGAPICDAIVVPKVALFMKADKKGKMKFSFKLMKAFFIKQGIPVRTVCQAVKSDCAFIQLKESRNAFNFQLIAKLRQAMAVLTLRTLYRFRGKRRREILSELRKIHIRQIDYTQDLSGFVMFLDLFPLLKEYGELIGMDYAREYNQLLTCVQYITFNEAGQPVRRLKVYNKFEHLLVSGQFKKKINMTLDKLLYPSLAFLQDKLLPAQEVGLTRIELSDYFHSYEEYQNQFGDFSGYRYQIDTALDALNQLKDKLYYKISLQQMLNSYFSFCKTQLVAFDNNIQVICYSYNARSYTFVGIINNRTRHSPSDELFLRKYLTVDGTAPVFLRGKFLGDVTKTGTQMQYPIWSFNEQHEEEHVKAQTEQLLFNLAGRAPVKITTGDQAIANYLDIPQTRLGYIQDEQIQEDSQQQHEQPEEQFVSSLMDDVEEQIDSRSKPEPEAQQLKKKRKGAPLCTCFLGEPIRNFDLRMKHRKNCALVQRKQEQEQQKQGLQQSAKKREEKQREKKRDRHIIRAVIEEEWEHSGFVGEGSNKKKAYICKLCGAKGVRSNNRRVHACPSKV